MLTIAITYILLLFAIQRFTAKKDANETFFRGERNSPWYAVAFGMVGASVSGVSFVSVPGWITSTNFHYLQTCIGFIVGYLLVARVLLPVYYRNNLTSIYEYLEQRFSLSARRTGSAFFLLSKLMGAAVRLYIVCLILQQFVLSAYGFSFAQTALLVISIIYLYTRRGGIRTIVFTDCLQTFVMLACIFVILCVVTGRMGLDFGGTMHHVLSSPYARVFEWQDFSSSQHFLKQFFSGIFIVLVMTGLDQDMMQKNLTCRTLAESQRNMCCYGLLFLPVNLLFLVLGVLLHSYAQGMGIQATGDQLLPSLCLGGYLGHGAMLLFSLGIMAACMSSADSAMTSLTTSICVDICRRQEDNRLRRLMHPFVGLAMLGLVCFIYYIGSSSAIDTVYVLASYTYGPLLGLFAFGLFTKRQVRGRWLPFVCLAAIGITYALDRCSILYWHYKFGYELLMINGLLAMTGMFISSFGIQRRR